MGRLAAAVIAMEVAALVVAYLAFGWPVLLVGAPLLVGTVFVLIVVRASEAPRRKLHELRSTRWETDTPLPGGLMSGFFQLSPQGRPAQVPEPTSRGAGN
ncbi:hypothetical protein ACVGVM_27205 [Pseudonocardia bannensis]|uniref:Uncharacterized protein n=1 Tax=Pseudonocardia bannensis TaxID=630973 RepID=A0A848DHA4_9PSEU|nr:hypothetical protein [Pseudonocardia bannensis]NMH91935.1 hypothetical protein [Pseudonocardia bannensis]